MKVSNLPTRIAAMGFLVMVVAGCATIASGTDQPISVSSNVDDATIYLDGIRIGSTPFNGPVAKGKSTMTLEAPGYRTETLSLSKSLDPAFWGNIIIGGTLGSVTDFATGAAYQYAPAAYQVEMRAAGQTEEAFTRQLVVRKFAMIYIDEISRDVSAGAGDHLSALVGLMTADGTPDVPVSAVSGALKASHGHPIQFGRRIVDLL